MSEGLRRRIAVDQSKEVSNPSLELQRYVEKIESGGGSTAKDKLFERVSGSKATEIYRKAYERWKSNLELMQATIVEVRCSNRVIVGLASENVLEASITLHPIYGMPILPGDGLKGLARHYFQEQSTGNPEQKKHVDVLFGDQNTKGSQAGGYISYLDAWWIPDGDPFVREIITVHHQKYYSKPKENAPTDFEDPIPVPYLSAQGRFLIAINGPTADWTELAKSVLLAALRDWGIGGKTSSGNGRFQPVDLPQSPNAGPWAKQPGISSATSAANEYPLLVRIQRMSTSVKSQINDVGDKWLKLPEGDERTVVGKALWEKVLSHELDKDKKFREKDWVIALAKEFGA